MLRRDTLGESALAGGDYCWTTWDTGIRKVQPGSTETSPHHLSVTLDLDGRCRAMAHMSGPAPFDGWMDGGHGMMCIDEGSHAFFVHNLLFVL